jgi:hypothetical protein
VHGLCSEGRAFAKAADETNQILGKAQKQEQKAVVAESKAEKDGSKAEQMVMKVVNAQSKDGARAAEAVAKAEILAAKVQTAQMQRNGLKGLKAMTKSILQTEKGVLKSLRTSLKAVKRPLKELKRGKRRLEKDLKTTSSGGVARSWHLTHPFVSADFRQHEHLLHARFDVNMSGPKHFALCLCCVCASCAIAIGALHPSFEA